MRFMVRGVAAFGRGCGRLADSKWFWIVGSACGLVVAPSETWTVAFAIMMGVLILAVLVKLERRAVTAGYEREQREISERINAEVAASRARTAARTAEHQRRMAELGRQIAREHASQAAISNRR